MARPDTIVSSRSPGPSGRGSGGLQPIGITRTHDLTAASFDRSRSFDGGYRGSYGGPRLGVPGYASSFYRYSPPAYRPGHYYPPYYKYPYYPYYPYYSHHHHGFSFGFGFYSGCYAYPTYPLVYYPSYYAPLYPTYYTPTFFPSYVSSVVVEQPATYAYAAEPSVTYYPSSGYVSSGESTATDAYVGYGSTTAPEVTYDQGYAAEQAQPPPSSTDRDVFVQNNVQVYPAPSAPETTPEPAPAAPATPWGPQQETVTPRQASPSHGHGPKIIEVPSEQPEPAPTPEPSAPSEAPAQPSLPTAELQELMVGGTKSFNEGRYAEAADVFRQVAQADPQNVDAALAHAVARFATGQYALAAESVRNGVKLFPPIVDTTFDLRERYSKVGDFVSQVRQLEQFVEKNPENADALLVLGFVRHFTSQRDLSNQDFERLKKQSAAEAPLADTFLHAMTPEQAPTATGGRASLPASGTTGPTTTAPAAVGGRASLPAVGATGPTTTAPAEVGGRASLPAFSAAGPPAAASGIVTTQPAGAAPSPADEPTDIEVIRGGPARPGVLYVATQPAAAPAMQVPGKRLFEGQLSLIGETLPREQMAVDEILIRLKGTDDDPPQAALEILIGDRRMKVRRFMPGAKVEVKGVSGQAYTLTLTAVDNRTETIGYVITK